MTNIKVIVKAGTAAKTVWQQNGATGYRITLKRNGKQMSVDFWCGKLCGVPSAFDVMYCLASDANSIEHVGNFNEWCDSMGYDNNSREDEKTYKEVVRQSKRLKNFLGDDFYTVIYLEEDELKEWCEK